MTVIYYIIFTFSKIPLLIFYNFSVQIKGQTNQISQDSKDYQSQYNSSLQQSQIQLKVNNIQQGYTKIRAYLLTYPEVELPIQNQPVHKVSAVQIPQRQVKQIEGLQNIQQEPQPLVMNKPFKNLQGIYDDYIQEYEQSQQLKISKLQNKELMKQQKQEQKLREQQLKEQQRLQQEEKRRLEREEKLRKKEEEKAEKLRRQQEKSLLLSQQKSRSTMYNGDLSIEKQKQQDEETTDDTAVEKQVYHKRKAIVEISDISDYLRYRMRRKQSKCCCGRCSRFCQCLEFMLLIFIAIVTSITLYLITTSQFTPKQVVTITGEKVQLSQQSMTQIQNEIQTESKMILGKIDDLKQQIQNLKSICNQKQSQSNIIQQQPSSECREVKEEIRILQEKIDKLSIKQANPYSQLIKSHTILKPRSNITSITSSTKNTRWWPQFFNLRDQMIPGECFAMKKGAQLHVITSPFYLRHLIIGHPEDEALGETGRAHAPANISFEVKYISGVNKYETVNFVKHFDLQGDKFQKIDFDELKDKQVTEINIDIDNEIGSKTVCLYEFTLLGDYAQIIDKQNTQ